MAQQEVMRVARIAQTTMKRSRHPETAKETDVAALLASVVDLHKPKLDRHKVSVSAKKNAMRRQSSSTQSKCGRSLAISC
jgi:hypothetical protein